jgi:hypothetical protein
MAGQAAVLARICVTADLRYPYAFFASFLATKLARALVLVYLDVRSPAYTFMWTASEPILLLLQMLAVGEIYDRICVAYPGIGNYKYRLLVTTAAVAALPSAFTLVIGVPRMMMWRYFVAVTVTSFVVTSSLVFLLLLWALFRHFPIARGRNLRLHWRVLTVYFGLHAAASIALIAFPGQQWVNACLLVGLIVCFSIWATKLTAEGELEQMPASDDEQRQWAKSQERAGAVLGRITVRELLELVVRRRQCQT